MAQAGRRWQRSLFPWLREWVDDLFTLYSHDGPNSLYERFTSDLASRWNVEDEGPISDLLNVDISAADG
eukprot:2886402-Pleurochrysis_carterae.AAC.1